MVNTIKKNWVGMSFKKWCELDKTDKRKIHYILTYSCGMKPITEQFTSEDEIDGIYLYRLQRSYIDKIELIDNEWYITLSD